MSTHELDNNPSSPKLRVYADISLLFIFTVFFGTTPNCIILNN